jgi:hypothetical protein
MRKAPFSLVSLRALGLNNFPVNIREAIATINQMQADGVVERYAIGGAVGATFYLEPIATLDVDVSDYFSATGHEL